MSDSEDQFGTFFDAARDLIMPPDIKIAIPVWADIPVERRAMFAAFVASSRFAAEFATFAAIAFPEAREHTRSSAWNPENRS